MATYQILDDKDQVINMIVADLEFVEQQYPGHFKEVVPPPVNYSDVNKSTAAELLVATDWVNQPDVIDPARSPHLTNQAEFLTYRSLVRAIAVNPPTTLVTDWPTIPTEVWA